MADRPGASPWRVALAWLPPLAWGLLVWQLGSDAWNVSETSRILGPLLDWLLPDLDFATRRRLLFGLRKLAHPGVYGVLTALALRAATRTLPTPRFAPRAALALAPALVLALADEGRQGRSALRTGSATDVLLDVAGGVALLALAFTLERCLARRRRATATTSGTASASETGSATATESELRAGSG